MSNDYTIGIIGGMGSYATLDFFKRILNAFPAPKEWNRPRIIIDNYCTMPSRVRAVLYHENQELLINKLVNSCNGLIAMGATKIVLACNTSHVFLPQIIEKLPKSRDYFINIIEECAKEIYDNHIKEVGLIASEGTIETKIYDDIFNKYNIKIISPNQNQFHLLRNFIEAAKQNNITDHVLLDFFNYLSSFSTKAVILGCTELPILFNMGKLRQFNTNKVIFDPLQSSIKRLKMEFEQSLND